MVTTTGAGQRGHRRPEEGSVGFYREFGATFWAERAETELGKPR